MQEPLVYLASASPRRRQLLEQIGVRFQLIAVAVDESLRADEAPPDYVLRLAREKAAAAIPKAQPSVPILAADTAVVLDGVVMGKPVDRAEGTEMLTRLAGRRHQVLSAVALWAGGRMVTALSVSQVRFGPVSRQQAHAYWDTGEPLDKAGGYGIQGRGALFVERLEGSYSGVMGLPLYETAVLLRQAGVQLLRE